MLVAENLSKTYFIKNKKHIFSKPDKTKKEVVKNLNLEVHKGQIVGILGINGAGKTTTIKMLTTMIEPTTGKITVDGMDAIKNNMSVKKKINLITGGERNIYWRLTAQENLEYFGNLYGLPKKQLLQKVEEVLKTVNLYDNKDVPVEKFSKGMKQRLQIARGLINDPDYIFMDEPTLGLDIVIAKELREYVKKIAYEENKGIVLTTHYISEAEELCDYIYVIDQGKFVFKGTSKELKNKYSTNHKYRIDFEYMDASFVNNLKEQKDKYIAINADFDQNTMVIESIDDNIHNIIESANRNNMKITKLNNIELSLEDALFKLMEDVSNENMD